MRSYGKIYGFGHREVRRIFEGPVQVEEKVDGSQFSFGVDETGTVLTMRSKGQDQTHNPDKLFKRAAATVEGLYARGLLQPGWTYRGEVLDTPRHNVLAYNRVPEGNVVIFDIDTGEEDYLDPDSRAYQASKLGLETVPVFFSSGGGETSLEEVTEWLERESFLGGPKVEGVVVKSLTMFGEDKKRLMAKHVSEAFKEVAAGTFRKANPTQGDVLEQLVSRYRTEARWQKALLHLRERGEITDSPRDIGPLVLAARADLLEEEEHAIKAFLFHHFWPKVERGAVAGLAEWYKQRLLELQFSGEDAA